MARPILKMFSARLFRMSEKALEAQCYVAKSDADAEARALKVTSFAYALTLPLSVIAIGVGAYFQSSATVIAASVVAIVETAPKAIHALFRHNPQSGKNS